MTFRFLPFKLNHLQFQPETAFSITNRKCEKCYKYFSEQSHFKMHISPPFFIHVLFSKQMRCPPSFLHFTQKCVKNPPNSSILFMNDYKWLFFMCLLHFPPVLNAQNHFWNKVALKCTLNRRHFIPMSCSASQFPVHNHLLQSLF